MILGDPNKDPTGNPATATLDGMFRRTAARKPDALALLDPPNREDFTDGTPHRLTYAEADRIVSAIAAWLRQIGLPADAIVGIQLPNTVESALTLLGVLRAGMIAMPMPLLWRHADAAAALGRLGARCIVTTTRVGAAGFAGLAMNVAAENFSVRHICAFGRDPPDGVIALDAAMTEAVMEPVPAIVREGHVAAHVAVVTWEVTPGGMVPVARNHAELIAGGLAAMLEGGLPFDAVLLGAFAPSSFAGLASTVLPWLLCGGTLVLHHGFEADAFAAQVRDERCNAVVIPGTLVEPLAETGLFDEAGPTAVLAVWRAPERLSTSPPWRGGAALTDLMAFGEIALLGARRDASGMPVALQAGPIGAPRGEPNAMPVAEITRSEAGTLALRGAMVPRHPFPPGADNAAMPHLKVRADGFVDTGYSCRVDVATGNVTITAPPPGIVSVGGYRFQLADIERLIRQASAHAFVTALPDALSGHRLAGVSDDGGAVRAALAERGANPLLADAFRDRRPGAAMR